MWKIPPRAHYDHFEDNKYSAVMTRRYIEKWPNYLCPEAGGRSLKHALASRQPVEHLC
jgi:hypothetical protein